VQWSSSNDGAWIGLLAALALVPLALRGPLPPDELRYLSVAWEMWSRGDLVLPYLNGAPYTDKGPLLFWLMHAGWAVFGVNDWWPRLLPALCALTTLLLTRSLALELWPEDRRTAALIPWLLMGSLAFAIYTQVVLVDLLLTCCTLLALLGMARAERGEEIGWLLIAAGTVLGLLTKGPVMLLHLSGAALLAPWWRRGGGGFAARAWYPRVAVAFGFGVALALVWGAFALRRGGAEYGTDVVMYQTAGRLVGSFAHRHAFWFYLVMLPVLLLPWSAWPAVWKAVHAALRAGLRDSGWRFRARRSFRRSS
jgi:4-amino-4-deoxy-L-arabinose transferase-like glycosyltransferase